MATYKVLQDIEAEDKLVGPFTLWQSIYAFVAGTCIYLSFIVIVKHLPFFLIILVPVILFVGFLAVPWKTDQPAEVWALAKLRFFLKPRRRIWDQSGMTELVEVTAPKHDEQRVFTDGLSQHEVRSRLHALANTLDSRGWAVKNVNVNVASMTPTYSASDRLVDVSTSPQEVSNLDIRPDDDILDEHANPVAHTFETMIDKAATQYRSALVNLMNQPLPQVPGQPSPPTASMPAVADASAQAPATNPFAPNTQTSVAQNDLWFMQPQTSNTPIDSTAATPAPSIAAPPVIQAAEPTADETALMEHIISEENKQDSTMYGRLKVVKTPEQLAEEAAQAAAQQRAAAEVTPEKQAAIINLSRSNDLSIDTLARQAKQTLDDDDEVVISLR